MISTPVEVVFRDFPHSPALDNEIRSKFSKLSKFYKRILFGRISISEVQKHKTQGKLFSVKIVLSLPRKSMVVSKDNEDAYIANRDAFLSIGRQLEEFGRKQNGHVKTHDIAMHGYIARLNEKDGYGFIRGIDGNEYYFSLTNVSHPSFNQLSVGDAVEYFPKGANDGRHAHHVLKEREVA